MPLHQHSLEGLLYRKEFQISVFFPYDNTGILNEAKMRERVLNFDLANFLQTVEVVNFNNLAFDSYKSKVRSKPHSLDLAARHYFFVTVCLPQCHQIENCQLSFSRCYKDLVLEYLKYIYLIGFV